MRVHTTYLGLGGSRLKYACVEYAGSSSLCGTRPNATQKKCVSISFYSSLEFHFVYSMNVSTRPLRHGSYIFQCIIYYYWYHWLLNVDEEDEEKANNVVRWISIFWVDFNIGYGPIYIDADTLFDECIRKIN